MKPTDGFAIFDKLLQKDHVEKIGPYEIQELIGQGGMGKVYRAYDAKLDRIIALKVIPVKDITFQKFLQKEAKAIARLTHPNIVKIYDFNNDHNYFYIAMEYLSGETLKEYLITNKPEYHWSLKVLAQVAIAIHHAHQEGIIHRDLKPENIMLQGDTPKIMDFGLAKFVDSTTIQESSILGTLAYMAPEQFLGKNRRLDQRTDIYALGTVMYEMLTKVSPFAEITIVNFSRIVEEVPQNPSKINPHIPKKISQICMKCLAKKPNERYSSAKILAKNLQAALHNKKLFSVKTFLATTSILTICFLTILLFIFRNDSHELLQKIKELEAKLESSSNINTYQQYQTLYQKLFMEYSELKKYDDNILANIEGCIQQDTPFYIHELYAKMLFNIYLYDNTLEKRNIILEKSLFHFQKAIELNDKAYMSYFFCHLIYHTDPIKEKRKTSFELLRKIETFPNEFGDYAKAFLLFSEMLHAENDKKTEGMNKALYLINQSLKQKEHIIYFYWLKILILRYSNQEQEALECCEEALKIEPLHPFILFERIVHHYKMHNLEAGLKDTEQIIQHSMYIPGLWYMRGRILKQLRQYQDAIDSFNKALEYGYDQEACYENRQNVYSFLKEYEKAISDCDKLIEIAENKEYYITRADHYLAIENPQKALVDYQKAYSLDKDDKKIVLKLANVYNLLGKYSKAKEMLEKLKKK